MSDLKKPKKNPTYEEEELNKLLPNPIDVPDLTTMEPGTEPKHFTNVVAVPKTIYRQGTVTGTGTHEATHTANSLIVSMISHGVLRSPCSNALATFNIQDLRPGPIDFRIVVFDLMDIGIAALHTSESAKKLTQRFMVLICELLSNTDITTQAEFETALQQIQFRCSELYLNEIIADTKFLINNKYLNIDVLLNEITDVLENKQTDANGKDILEMFGEINKETNYLKDLYNFVNLVITNTARLLSCTIYDVNNQIMILKEYSTDPELLASDSGDKQNWDILITEGPQVRTGTLHDDRPKSDIRCPPHYTAEDQIYTWFRDPTGDKLSNIIATATPRIASASNGNMTTTNKELFTHLLRINDRKINAQKDHSLLLVIDASCQDIHNKTGVPITGKQTVLKCQEQRDEICDRKIQMTDDDAIVIQSIMKKDTDLMFEYGEIKRIFADLKEIKRRMTLPDPTAKKGLAKNFSKFNIAYATAHVDALLPEYVDALLVNVDTLLINVTSLQHEAEKVVPPASASAFKGGRRKRKSKKQKGSKGSKRRKRINKKFRKTYKKRKHVRKTRKR